MQAIVDLGLTAFAFGLLVTSAASIAYYLRRGAGESAKLPLGPPTCAQWTALDSLIVFLFYLGMNLAAAQLGAWLSAILRPGSDQSRTIAVVAFTYLFSLPVLGLVYLYGLRSGRPGTALGLTARPPFRSAAFGIMFFLLFIPFGYIYPTLVSDAWVEIFRASPKPQEVIRRFADAGLPLTVTLAAAATLAAPIVEEIVFRGFIQQGIENSYGTLPAVVITSLVFSAMHASVHTAIEILPLAMLLSIAYARTRNLLINIMLHATFNASSIVMLLAARSYGVDLTQ